MAGLLEEGEAFGQFLPSVAQHLKENILQKYPDSGQILKELIQNADDASATEVSFLLDHTDYNTRGVPHKYPALQPYQGPALYAINNGVFTEQDWEGIRATERGAKRKDPLRIGRFGVGFNSVYHITDVPSVMSGEYILILDPLNRAFPEGGRRFNISGCQRYAEFLPFLDKIGHESYYPMTLFRFPLRIAPSDLSDTIYIPARMRERFKELLEDRDCLLLFLKNIEKVTFEERDGMHGKTRVITTITKDHGSRLQWERFLHDVSLGHRDVESCESVTMRTKNAQGVEATSQWLVKTKAYALANPVEQQLCTRLGVIPWVGVAMRAHEPPQGRIFCFLPLPSDPENSTGLPVHVHGYFGLSDNRRSVTWTSSDQRDDTTEWNTLLLTRLIPKAYAELLEVATVHIDESCTCPSLIYDSWPYHDQMTKRWKELLSQFAADALKLPVFHTKASGGQWLHLSEIYTNDINDRGIKEAVEETLLGAGVNVATLPPHVNTVVAKAGYKPISVYPDLVRAVLKQVPSLQSNATRHKKLHLLEYTLSDSSYENMVGLQLLPLQSKEFAYFTGPRVAQAVYLSSERHPASLLPGLNRQIVDVEISPILFRHLVALAWKGVTQVGELTPSDVVRLLPYALPQHWCHGSLSQILWQPEEVTQPPLTWLSSTWIWITQEFPNSLAQFEGLPLLPASHLQSRPIILFPLRKLGAMMTQGGSSQSVCAIVGKVGVNLFHSSSALPPFISHNLLMPYYIVQPTPIGVLSVLNGREKWVESELNREEKVLLRGVLAKIEDDDLTEQHRIVLSNLPVLECQRSTAPSAPTEFTSAKCTSVAMPKDHFPEDVLLKGCLLSSRDSSSVSIHSLLKLHKLTLAELLIENVLPLVPNLPYPKVQNIMIWVLDWLPFLRCQRCDIVNHIENIAFVTRQYGGVAKPSELFDPRSPGFHDLFAGENVFPAGIYCTEARLSSLGMLGLKTTPTTTDIVTSAMQVSRMESCIAIIKAKEAFQWINRSSSLFTEHDQQLLQEHKWMPCRRQAPDGYPAELEWFGENVVTARPENVADKTMISLVGSTMPILDGDPSEEFKSTFKWPKQPPIEKVVQNLQSVIHTYLASTSRRGLGALTDIIIFIYHYFANRQVTREQLEREFSRFGLTNWVWNGSDFTSPERVAVDSDITFNLSPYLYVLPTELSSDGGLRRFFMQTGVSERFEDVHVVSVLHDIQRLAGNGGSLSPSELGLCLKILNFLTKNCSQACTADGMLVPTHDYDGKTRLVPPQDCMYCDSDWLRERGHDYQLSGSFRMLHQSISPKMANQLGIPSLTHRLVQPTALGPGIQLFGQKEPITRRLKTIIDEYKEGPGIFYELIQNADDAGATEVKFAVDWRQNPQARKTLLTPEMADCHGPALWAYNNKVFTDEDIQNITEISGATKKRDTNKIGRFGLGFNSVYHITDVPSFISRHYFVCFDPHTTHLSPLVNHLEPGVRIEWNRNDIRRIYSDQFEPFNGIFDCNIFNSDTYPATLFRFPFRTEQEAQRSEIGSTVYDRDRLFRLLTHFAQNLDTLLLFTQHVRSVTVVEIHEEGTCQELMHVMSTVTPLIKRSLQHWSQEQPPGLLQIASSHMEEQRPRPPEISPMINDIFMDVTDRRIAIEAGTSITTRWLISSCIGSAESLGMAQTPQGRANGLIPCASVATYLEAGTNLPKRVVGKAFCFLPLPECTDLPIHVNAPFAILSNRQGICKSSGSGMKESMEVEWNKCLLRDAIPTAYLTLLQYLAQIEGDSASHVSDPFCIWPNVTKVNDYLFQDNLVPCFYEKVLRSPAKVILSLNKSRISMEEATFLHPTVREGVVGSEALQILHIWIDRQVEVHEQAVVDLPRWVFEGFLTCNDHGEIVKKRALSLNTLYNSVFCPAVKDGSLSNHRSILDRFVLHLLDEVFDELSAERDISYNSLRHLRCVPSSPQGTLLRCPSELVHPTGTVATLFDQDDQRFPYGKELNKRKRMESLMHLGMMTDYLPWGLLLERATSFEKLYLEKDQHQALERMSFLYNLVVTTPALVADKPNTSYLSRIAVKDLLIVAQKPPTDRNSIEILPTLCHAIYSLLQRTACTTRKIVKGGRMVEICSFSDDGVRNTLMNGETVTPFIYTARGFVTPRHMAFKNAGRPMRMLGVVPKELQPYSCFLRCCGVREYFEATDFVAALENMATMYGSYPLGQADLEDSLALAENLEKEHIHHVTRVVEMPLSRVFLPDRKGTLRRVSELAYNDAHWMPEDPSIPYYVHPDIPFRRAVKFFGVKTVRSKLVDQTAGDFCDIGEDFGQGEELTDRIKGILDSYSSGFDIFKELLQNADDAGATEVKFIFDTRRHSDERIFGKEWGHLQGPALLVYNNKTFSQSDIIAIQKIGKGNKQEKGSAIGKFGIGFNAVYHLTDCPSFITDNQLMCIFDPHTRYIPGASMRKPGRLVPVQTLEDKFPDVLKTFLVPNEEAPLEGSTLFRFPLRSNEMPSSKIRNATFSSTDIHSMMASFWKEASQAILFLNNIEKVSFASIEGNDLKMQTRECYVEHYVVRKALSETTKNKRDAIAYHVNGPWDHGERTVGIQDILAITPMQKTYQVVIEKTSDRPREVSVSRWLISERVGFDKRPDLCAEELSFARLTCIMPRVAVASLLETRSGRPQPAFVLPSSNKFCGKAFCYLPLPVKTTCLPVHVNGYFALDPARRNLTSSGLHGEWNELLKTQLLAPAYFALLEAAREELLSPTSSKGFQFRHYCSLFPVVNKEAEAGPFNALAAELYRIIASRDENLLPVVVEREQSLYFSFQRPSDCLFEYRSDDVNGTERPGDTQSYAAKKVLLSIGCNIVETTYMGNVYTDFLHARSRVKQFSPSSVVEWLRAQSLSHLQDTCLTEDTVRLKDLLNYCLYPVYMGSQSLNVCLHDTPLLLAQDNNLYRFNKKSHVFVSNHHALVSAKYSHMFAHESLIQMLFSFLRQDSTGTVIKYFDVQDLALLANRHSDIFPSKCLIRTTGHCPWDPVNATKEPTTQWIKRLWQFLFDRARNEADLLPIKDWQVIPSKRPSLFSLANAKMTFTSETRASHKILDILRKLGCPFVNEDLLGEGLNIVRHSLASPSSSKDVLTVLEGVMKEGYSLEGILNEQESSALLLHLQRDIGDLRCSPELIGILKSLPLFQTLDGGQMSLCDVEEALVLDTNVSTGPFRINTLLKYTRCIALRRIETLLALYEVVGVKTVSQVILHIQHILPVFSLLRTSEQRILYMTYIKDRLLPFLFEASPERKQLLQKLSSTAFIPDIDGKLVTPNQFYNPNEPLFGVAKDHVNFIQFPPRPFCEETWIDFLADVGLQTNMDPRRYLQCVKTVEQQLCGKRNADTESLERLAFALVIYLFEHADDLQEVLEEVSKTRFIPCHRASQYLTDIHPSVREETICFSGSVTCHEEFLVWTRSLALPEWATPPTHELKTLLGVQNSPLLDDVIANCVNICTEVEGGDVDRNVRQVMQRIYHFFQESCAESPSHCFENQALLPGKGCDNCKLISRTLSRIPCVIIEVGSSHRLSVGAKVVFEMRFEDKSVFDGYLYGLSRKLGQHEALFRSLGATENVTLAKYALVLSKLVGRYGSDTSLHEDTLPWKTACVAVGRIVELSYGENGPNEWHDFKSQTSHPILYLPTQTNTLVPSQDIVIIEGKDYDRSIMENPDKKVLTPWLTLSRPAVESIPEDFRPVFLSDITEEEFSERSTPCKDGQECQFLAFYAKTLRDENFCRLLALAISFRGQFADKSKLIPKVRTRLAGIELHCYNTIELQQIDLQNQGTLSNKGKEMQVYLSVRSTTDGSSCADMFLKHNATLGGSACMIFNFQLAKALCDVFKEYDMDLESVLEEVMKLQPTTDTLDVVRYESPQRHAFPLGSPCKESRVSHRPDVDFEEGEIVAYRLPSAGQQEEVFHTIFAKVVKEEKIDDMDNKEEEDGLKAIASGQEIQTFQTQTNTTLDFERVFEIHVNDDDEIMPVKVTDLYKIDEDQAVQVMVESEAFQHVTHVLEEAWDLEKDDHKRVVGRLFLYWHPKSNPSNEVYAQRVIGHIRSEIKRLLREDEESSSSSSPVDDSSYHGGGAGYRGTRRPRGFHSMRRSGLKRTGRSSRPFLLHEDSRMIQHQDVPGGKRKSHNRQLCDSDYDEIFTQLEDLTIAQRTHKESCRIEVGGFGVPFGELRSRETQSDRSQPLRVIPNHDQARRWFGQAKYDFLAARHCWDGGFYCSAASMCHQAAEKALKAALFVVDGCQHRGHILSGLAWRVAIAARQPAFNEVVNITHELSRLKCNNEMPRYPDQWASPGIPAAAYSREDINDMLRLTDTVLRHVSSLM